MQTDELRAELAQLAREVEPFTGDLPGVRRRVARRRVAAASIAIVLVAAVTAGVVAATAGGTRRVQVAHSAKEVELDRMDGFDAVVVLPAAATADDADRIATVLNESPSVAEFSPLPAAGLVLSLGSGPDERRLIDRVCNDTSARSFAVKSAGAHATTALSDAIASRATVLPVNVRGVVDDEIFMRAHATTGQTDAVRAALERDPDVAQVRYVTHQDAYDEFKRRFADQPDLVQSEPRDGSDLPESFRLILRRGASTSAVADRYRPLPGVDRVIQSVKLNTLSEVCTLRHSSP